MVIKKRYGGKRGDEILTQKALAVCAWFFGSNSRCCRNLYPDSAYHTLCDMRRGLFRNRKPGFGAETGKQPLFR
jgi:hypothetical protein